MPATEPSPLRRAARPVFWSERHRGHAPHGGYWLGVRETGDEEPERGDLLADGLRHLGYDTTTPDDLGRDPITAVHDPEFVDFMARAYPAWVAEGHLDVPGQPHVVPYLFATTRFARHQRPGRRPATIRAELGCYAMDTMTLLGEGTFDAASSAVHCAVAAADAVMSATTPPHAAYAAVRPPGHHAGPAFFGGSCYFNSAAAAAQRLRLGGHERVAVVDIDAHQGNGTQEIFWERDDVFYGSVHVDPAAGWFPHLVGYADEIGGGRGEGANRNEPVPPGTGDEPWLAALGRVIDAAADGDPTAMVVSLGVDAAVDDPAAPLEVTAEGFHAAGRLLGALSLPTVFVQEGGYDLVRLVELVDAVLSGHEEASRA